MSSEDLPEEENGYSLKGSTKLVGQLYPVLKAKDGEILDGLHRSGADGSWRSEVLENIDSHEKKLAARLIANFHRRKVSREEKAEWINELAQLYREQGLRVQGEKDGSPGQGSNEIADRICLVTGISRRTVCFYLEDHFKQMNYSRDVDQHRAEAPASDVIKNIVSVRCSQNNGYADRLLERYQDELLESPAFRARVLAMLPSPNGSGAGVLNQIEQLPPGVERDKNGFLVYKRKHGKKFVMKRQEKAALKGKLPKGYGLPKKDKKLDSINPDEAAGYFELFRESFPDCQCSSCAHWKECDVAVQPDE
jgi:hypothetical protein